MAQQEITDLIKAAEAFVDELRLFGYGETNLKPLPGSFEPFVAALEAAREKMIDEALDQDGGNDLG
ncbi:hypothetical protein J2T08_000551 [Neorhizobium galegae]|uniref:hypothetical protein n=1 Tax=Neorhizobium galegae TaxID=399 RepID=UPI0027899C2F|nr:hypothetical protein [Neorhizobium galegae]MDQ0132650.1 hypothetical protein [Neorhizobium galegae]